MNTYELVIGLEIHIKLNTKSKLFCSCNNSQDFNNHKANSNICPVCTGQPGALPVLQVESVQKAFSLGKVLGCTISKTISFDRKSYFYPDLPFGYQITQFHNPILSNGKVEFFSETFEEKTNVTIHEAHLEIDTGKMSHDGKNGYLDYNRSGTPLIEIVTNPDFRSENSVIDFLKELQRRVKRNKIGDADLEKGQMRVDVNLSLRPKGQTTFNTRVELKNMNSFSAIRRAIQHEITRQSALYNDNKTIEQQTLGRDDIKGETYVMRSKGDALDYRYFPEPDLPECSIDNFTIPEQTIEIPSDIIGQMKTIHNFNKEFINGIITNYSTFLWYQSITSQGIEPKIVAKRIVGPINGYCNQHNINIDNIKFSQKEFYEFCLEVQNKSINDNQAKQIIEILLNEGGSTKETIKKLGFDQKIILDLITICKEVIGENQNVVEEYKKGKVTTIGFLVGQAMKKSQGKANPNELKNTFEGLLI